MKNRSTDFGRLVVGIVGLSFLLNCPSPEKAEPPENTANVNASEPTPVEVKKATGKVIGMKPAFDQSGKPIVMYIVKMDNGTEVSARTPYQDAGRLISSDTGKKVELVSLSGDEAKTALAA